MPSGFIPVACVPLRLTQDEHTGRGLVHLSNSQMPGDPFLRGRVCSVRRRTR